MSLYFLCLISIGIGYLKIGKSGDLMSVKTMIFFFNFWAYFE